MALLEYLVVELRFLPHISGNPTALGTENFEATLFHFLLFVYFVMMTYIHVFWSERCIVQNNT